MQRSSGNRATSANRTGTRRRLASLDTAPPASPSAEGKEPTEVGVSFAPTTPQGGSAAPASSSSTPEQRAATKDQLNGWTRARYLEALAGVGNTEEACRIAGFNPWTVYQWRKTDPTLGEQEQQARARFGQKVLGRATGAVLAASDEQLVKTPTLAIAAVNWFNPELRPGPAGQVQVAVQVNLADKLTSQRLEEIAAACEAGD